MTPLAPTGASLAMAVVIGVLFSCGTYLLLQRSLTRVLVGLSLLTHGANVLLLVAGGTAGAPPFLGEGGAVPRDVADPLPQAMALTAIVISFAVSALLLALAYRSWAGTRDDAVQDDLEDRRISELGPDAALRLQSAAADEEGRP